MVYLIHLRFRESLPKEVCARFLVLKAVCYIAALPLLGTEVFICNQNCSAVAFLGFDDNIALFFWMESYQVYFVSSEHSNSRFFA